MLWKIVGLVGAAILTVLLCRRLLDARRVQQITQSGIDLERRQLLTELHELDRQLADLPDGEDALPLQRRRLKLQRRLERLG